MMIRHRELLPKLGLAAVALCVTLAIAEMFLRVVYDPLGWLAEDNWQEKLYETLGQQDGVGNRNPDPDVKSTFGGSRRGMPLPYASYRVYVEQLFEPADSTLMYVHRPNVSIALEDSTRWFYTMSVHTNSIGLRDDDIPVQKPQGEVRILFVGDSVTFGPGVDDEETFVQQLEASLNHAAREPVRFSVINYGVGGYNLAQELALLKRTQAMSYSPDLILVGVVLNDDGQSNSFIEWNQTLAALANESTSHRIQAALGQDLRLARLLLWSSHSLRERFRDWRSSTQSVSADDVVLREEGCEWLVALDEYARENRVPIGFTVFPQEYQFSPGHRYQETTQRKYDLWLTCARHTGSPTLDMYAALEDDAMPRYTPGSISNGLYVRWDSIHLNAAGHREVAKVLMGFVRSQWLGQLLRPEGN